MHMHTLVGKIQASICLPPKLNVRRWVKELASVKDSHDVNVTSESIFREARWNAF
jgi:hypothetical protein